MNPNHILHLDVIVTLIASIPRLHGTRISWISSPKIVAAIVADILSAPETPRETFVGREMTSANKRIRDISAKTKVNEAAFKCFVCGNKLGNMGPWIELQNELDLLGVEWIGKPKPKSDKPIIRKSAANNAAPIPEIPHVIHATESGKVIPINSIPPSPAMIAQPGEFATKQNTKVEMECDLDEHSNFVVTTTTTVKRIVMYNTAEHKVLMQKAFKKKRESQAV